MRVVDSMEDRLARLSSAVSEVRAGARASPRTSRLLSGGVAKMAKKVVEEATEVAVDAVQLRRAAVISESVDLFYNSLCFGTNWRFRPRRCGPKWTAESASLEWSRSYRRNRISYKPRWGNEMMTSRS